MKKLILPIIFLVLLSFVEYSYAHDFQTPKDCLEERHEAQYQCGQIHKACVERCSGPTISDCIGACFDDKYECYDAAKAVFDQCLSEEQNTSQKSDEQPALFRTPFTIPGWLNFLGQWNILPHLNTLLSSGNILANPEEGVLSFPEARGSLDPEGKRWDFLKDYIPHESIDLGKSMRISKDTKLSEGGDDPASGKKLVNLEEDAIEVIRDDSSVADSEYDGIKTPNGTVISVQTHYWVSYDKKNNQTTVVVYEGKVEVTANDGKSAIVTPNGDKPGVAVVSQKLSPLKLALAGLVLVVIVGGIILIIRKKFTSTGFNKKKK